MNLGRHLSALALGICFAGIASPAMAQPVNGQPASALVFPYFDSRAGMGTFITVTNTNTSRLSCNLLWREGDVLVHYVYFGFNGGNSNDPNDPNNSCSEFDTNHLLTPGDTLTVLADQDNPELVRGWLWVEARDPETQQAIDFDYLIGSAIVVNTGAEFLFHYLPYSFRSLASENISTLSDPEDNCGRAFTDLNNDGEADFDGMEYDFWPAILLLDQFFGTSVGVSFIETITLASCDVDHFDNDDGSIVHVIRWNNREQFTSRTFSFDCWFNGLLSDISNAFNTLNGDPNELVVGNKHLQSGWASFVSENDAIVGVLHQAISSSQFAAGHQIQFTGGFGDPLTDPDTNHSPCFLVRNN
jgi:hypothetical protein